MKLSAVIFSIAALFVPAIASADPMQHRAPTHQEIRHERQETRRDWRQEIRHEREVMRDRIRNAERAFHREVRDIRHDVRR